MTLPLTPPAPGMNTVYSRPDKAFPMRFALVALLFIYVMQYPLSLVFNATVYRREYSFIEWIIGYEFVIGSSLLLIAAVYFGISGGPTIRRPKPLRHFPVRIISFPLVLVVFLLLFVWSYIMASLHIGITIYTAFAPLPFKLAGFLVYVRLFIHPLIIAYICHNYSTSQLKPFLFLLVFILGAWASLTSGSRFVAIGFSLPLLLLFKGAGGYLSFSLAAAAHMTIANLSRSFYLPFLLGDEFIIQTYANAEYQEYVLNGLFTFPLTYLVVRTMGMAEVLMTMTFGTISTSAFDSLHTLVTYYIWILPDTDSVSIKSIYGFGDDVFGGFALDIFSNYWVLFGGSIATYSVGLSIAGWLLGRSYRLLAVSLIRFGFQDGAKIVFVLLFFILFDGRAFLFPIIAAFAFLFSRQLFFTSISSFARRIYSVVRIS